LGHPVSQRPRGEPLLRHEEHDFEIDREYLHKMIRKDSDGQYFIDYLSGMMGEFDDVGGEFDFFDYHRDLVIEKGNDNSGIAKLAAKYRWLANYHNAVMNDIPDEEWQYHALERDNYLITSASC
jgi:hypothetical protein